MAISTATTTMTSNSNSSSTTTSGDYHRSDAALGTLYLPNNNNNNDKLEVDDWMWHILMQYIQQTTYQLTIIRNTTSSSSSNDTPYLVLGGGGSTTTATTSTKNVIRERNAIVRSLIGMGLHGALDSGSSSSGTSGVDDVLKQNYNFYWSGGTHSMHSSCHATSHMAAVQQAQTRHYASLATQLRRRSHHHGSNHNDMLLLLSMVVQELNQTLQTSAFLLPYSSTLSFVDMDVAVALSIAYTTTCSPDAASAVAVYHDTFPVHVQRWMRITMFHIQQLSRATQVACPHPDVATLMDHVILASPSSSPSPLVFYNGTEDVSLVLSQWSSSLSSPTPSKPGLVPTTAKTQNTTSSTITITPNIDAPTAAVVVTEPGTGSKKLTKQDKKVAAAAAKAAAAGGEATTTTTTKIDTTTPKSSSEAPVVAYDITAMDIRIGKIIKIWPHESADKLYCEDIDFGNGEVRQIASGLRPFYPDPNDLLHQLVLVVYNLKKRSLVGFSSHGMVLCASNADHTAVELIVPPPNAPLGERVVFEGLDPTIPAEPESKVAKKKIFEAVAPDLVTNESGYVQWKTHAASCSVGPIRAVNGMSLAHVA